MDAGQRLAPDNVFLFYISALAACCSHGSLFFLYRNGRSPFSLLLEAPPPSPAGAADAAHRDRRTAAAANDGTPRFVPLHIASICPIACLKYWRDFRFRVVVMTILMDTVATHKIPTPIRMAPIAKGQR